MASITGGILSNPTLPQGTRGYRGAARLDRRRPSLTPVIRPYDRCSWLATPPSNTMLHRGVCGPGFLVYDSKRRA